MRTLLVDNYDSYTYNLFQLIAQVNGAEPVVLHNDSPDCADLDLNDFDNVVISPGPGDPTRPKDFGACAPIIESARLPVLGVCLGHQGIAAGSGAEIVRAPAARHGHLTAVRHDGRELFHGLPQDFTAVRYHSLCVREPLPPELEATAWAEDGVLMGLRHRTRPLWGVQFHPESVATEFGYELLGNFRDLTERWHHARGSARRSGPSRSGTRLAPVGTGARPAPRPVEARPYRLHSRIMESAVDTEAAFTRLFADSSHAFWLDSSLIDPRLSRFSFLGDASGPLSEIVRYRVGDGAVEVTAAGGLPRRVDGTVFDYLQTALRARRVESPALPVDFACGYVGYFGYELKADCGGGAKHTSPTPDAYWIFADRLIAVDHQQGATYLLALSDGSPRSDRDATVWLEGTAAALAGLPRPRPTPVPDQQAVDNALLEPALVRDRAQYLDDIAACRQQLLAGESYEICLTNAVRAPRPADGLRFYRSLRRSNPAPYAAYLRLDGMEIACSSPERFLRITRDGMVETKPIKGTARRGADEAEDSRLRRELTTSAKVRAENLMIVDLLRNDLGRVCEVGSVTVPRLMRTETYATVHQLVSTVRGRLRADADALDCVRACFPGGSMTGAPKLRTLDIIDSLETEARGVYSGAIGFLSCNGTADLNIVIRTAVLTDEGLHAGAGGAIVLDSDLVEEYEEMLLKAATSLRVLLTATSGQDTAPATERAVPARAAEGGFR
ncbi:MULTISPECIES: aminodeoxychorismate synthase component I [unclassified Streptomyces]|uniref:aminodeoxychorismate synthase component I n=1 Tax=unclassified Streptomyces TaxID=2593676 RepID=UPI0005EE08A2|nr:MULTISPECIES: aminodeoxychorismate synthase component I [unclassified Streptomyces]UJV46053.1 aminodeoxychorismate synthase, component I [Streptomyces sp. AMCC400023]